MVTRFVFTILFLLFLFIGCAPTQTEQGESRADVLWEMHQRHAEAALAEYETGVWENLDSYQMVMTMTLDEEGERFETVVTSIADIAERRLISTTVSEGEYGFTTWLLYDQGELTMLSDFDGELERDILDEAQEAEATAGFEKMFDLVADMRDPATLEAMREAEGTGRYDGYQSYGNVLAGEQVTFDLSESPFFTNFPGGVPGESSLVFTPEGFIAGQVVQGDNERIITVFDEPTVLVNMARDVGYTMYALDGEALTRQSDVRMEITPNPELAEDAFELPPFTGE